MDNTPNLQLPYLIAAQAQKHVTHNEALRTLDAVVQLLVLDKDLAGPPGSPVDGSRYIVAASPTGAWSGQAGKIAAWQDGAWMFYAPREGWLAWVADEDTIYAWDGSAWGAKLTLLGINATADTTNRLAVKSAASLLDNVGNGHQQKINKAAASDTASTLYQTNYSGRAEYGLTGDDNFHVKVSPDGASWTEAIVVDRTTGNVGLGASPSHKLDVAGAVNISAGSAYKYGGYNVLIADPAAEIYFLAGAGNLTATGIRNVGVGAGALAGVTTGNANLGIGAAALANTTTGVQNMALGSQTLQNNVSGAYNVAIGQAALLLNQANDANVGIGAAALAYANGGSYNIGIGFAAGYPITTGARNIVIGSSPGTTYGPTTGSDNILIGHNMDLPSHTASNQLDIGNLIYGTGVDGTGATLSSGKVGIGTAAPSNKLSVEGIAAPETDNSYTLGTSGKRWSEVYAATGTINTSDGRLKTGIEDSPLGLAFLLRCRPRSYKWCDGGTMIEWDDESYEVQEPLTEERSVTETVVEVRDGVAVERQMAKVVRVPVPIVDLVPVIDEAGAPVMVDGRPKMHAVPRVRTVTKTRKAKREVVRAGRRTHYGLIAQEVKAALDAAGVGDFAGWVLGDKDDPSSTQGLRYDQFVAPLIKAVQELAARVAALEARLPT